MEDVCLELAVGPSLDVFTWGSFDFTGRLGDPESAGAAEVDSVRSRSDADSREAEAVVGNNVATGTNTSSISPLDFLGGFTRGPFVTTGRLNDPKSAGAADGSRSEADFRDAEVVVCNNAETGDNTRGPNDDGFSARRQRLIYKSYVDHPEGSKTTCSMNADCADT